MRRAQHLDVQQAFESPYRRCSAPSPAPPAVRQGPAGCGEGGAGGGISIWVLPLDCVFDRAVAGAAAQITFQRRAEVLPLRLVERSAGQDHAGGAEAALKGLGIEERLLHRVGAAVGASPSMVVTA